MRFIASSPTTLWASAGVGELNTAETRTSSAPARFHQRLADG